MGCGNVFPLATSKQLRSPLERIFFNNSFQKHKFADDEYPKKKWITLRKSDALNKSGMSEIIV